MRTKIIFTIILIFGFQFSFSNSWIAPENHFEENAQIVNEIYLNTWAQGIFEFDSTQYYFLNAIATENPLTGRDAVYLARIMLDLNVDDFLPSGNKSILEKFNVKPKSNFIIMPNPAKDLVTISKINNNTDELWSLWIYDVIGNLVYKLDKQKSSTITTDLRHLKQGVYFLKLGSNDNEEEIHKLILIK